MNRRGDIPMILLFIITLILVALALFSMVSFNNNLAKNSEGRSEMLARMAFLEDYVVAKTKNVAHDVIVRGGELKSDEDLRAKFEEIVNERNFGVEGTENYFGKILRGEFVFSRDKDKYWLEIKDLNLEASRGANSIKRNVNLRIEFDYSGDLIRIERNLK